jgi:hypothetical protein
LQHELYPYIISKDGRCYNWSYGWDARTFTIIPLVGDTVELWIYCVSSKIVNCLTSIVNWMTFVKCFFFFLCLQKHANVYCDVSMVFMYHYIIVRRWIYPPKNKYLINCAKGICIKNLSGFEIDCYFNWKIRGDNNWNWRTLIS